MTRGNSAGRGLFLSILALVCGLALASLPRGRLWLDPAPTLFPPSVELPGASGRLSLRFVIYASLALFWLVAALFAYIAAFKGYHRLRRAYRDRRKALFRTGIELVLMEEPVDRVLEALRPRRLFDAGIVQEVLLESMRHLRGQPFETLREAAIRLGFVERNLRWLRSRSPHTRGRAMEALGFLRSARGAQVILELLGRQPLDLQLVALRSLATIRDPAALPRFLEICDRLPPPVLTRVASLMLEFGPSSHPYIRELFNKHRDAFPDRVFEEVLKELASEMARP